MNMHSIRGKFTISSAIVITAMILLIEVSIYMVAVRQQLKDSGQLYSDLVDTMGKSFDDMHLSFKRGINFITMNEDLQQVLAAPYDTQDEYEELNGRLKVLLTDRALLVNEIKGVYLFDADGKFRMLWKKKNIMGEVYLPFSEIEEEWFLPSGKVSSQMIGDSLVFTRAIRRMKNLQTIGYLMVVYDDELLNQRVEGVLPNDASSILVFDADGCIITHNYHDEEVPEHVLEELDFAAMSEYEVVKLNGGGQVMVSQYLSDSTGWRIVSLVDVSYIIRSSVLLRNLVLILGIAAVLGGTAIQWEMARRIVKPLNHMVEVVGYAKDGDYTKRMEINTRDELMILGDAFNHMRAKTDVLVNQVLKDEIKFKEEQLALMQAQINPHLLYNTLECINWLAEFDRKEEIRQVTIAFSNLMKSLTSERKMVTVEEEISYVRDFLSIYQIMLEGHMEYQIEVASELLKVEIPRLLIQPLVENSVVHGIKQSLDGGQIHVSVMPSERGFLISVLDDGAGMSAGQVERILAFAAGEKRFGEEIGLGLRNVIERLALVYGDQARFHVTSDEGWGTTMDIFIPAGSEPVDNRFETEEEQEYGIFDCSAG